MEVLQFFSSSVNNLHNHSPFAPDLQDFVNLLSNVFSICELFKFTTCHLQNNFVSSIIIGNCLDLSLILQYWTFCDYLKINSGCTTIIWFRIWEKGTNVLGIFWKIRQFLNTAFYAYHRSIHLAVIKSSPIFPVR